MRLILPLIATCLAGPAMAQSVMPCGWQDETQNIVDGPALFANGAVRVTLLDVDEPAAAAFYLKIEHPPENTCTVVGISDSLGFSNISFNELESSYNPETGLALSVPVTIYDPEVITPAPTVLLVIVNQATGVVTASQPLISE